MSETNYSGLANDYPVVTLRQLQASLQEPYPLRLVCPDANASDVLMEFQVTASRLEADLGYLAIYEPDLGSKITQPLVEREYRHVIALSPEQCYVHYLNIGITALNLPYPYV